MIVLALALLVFRRPVGPGSLQALQPITLTLLEAGKPNGDKVRRGRR